MIRGTFQESQTHTHTHAHSTKFVKGLSVIKNQHSERLLFSPRSFLIRFSLIKKGLWPKNSDASLGSVFPPPALCTGPRPRPQAERGPFPQRANGSLKVRDFGGHGPTWVTGSMSSMPTPGYCQSCMGLPHHHHPPPPPTHTSTQPQARWL